MLQKIKKLSLSLSFFFLLLNPLAGTIGTTAIAHAANTDVCSTGANGPTCPSDAVCSGATNLQIGGTSANDNTPTAGSCGSADETSTVNHLITTILNVFSVVVGIIAVVMIIYAGFKYITSGGKDESVKTAKNTILYAVIGLVIVALAQVVVKFVLNKATSSSA